jgi:hypothetical protein
MRPRLINGRAISVREHGIIRKTNNLAVSTLVSVVLLCTPILKLRGGTGLSNFATSYDQHWSFQANNGHIYQVVFSGTWGWEDVNAQVPAAPPPIPISAVSTFATSYDQHWSYQGTSQHIYQIVLSSSGWGWEDVSAQAPSAPLPAYGTAIGTFATSYDQHWSYQGTSGHIYQIVLSSSGWGWEDVSAQVPSAPVPPEGAPLSNFYTAPDQHWSYVGSSGHIYQIVLSPNNSWGWEDVTAQVPGATAPAAGTALSTFATSYDQHWVYQTSSGQIWQLVFNGTWGATNISAETPTAPLSVLGTGIGTFAGTSDQHWSYQASNGQICQIVLDSAGWGWENVTATAKAIAAEVLYSISGQVKAGSSGLGGVPLTLSGTNSSGTKIALMANTSSSGSYSFSAPAGGTYTVMPSSPASTTYTFSPETQSFSNLTNNVTAATFVATAQPVPTQADYTISGQVLAAGYPLPGVTMTLSGTQSGKTLTTSSGGYSFTVAATGTYTVTPSLSGYTFSPASRTYANVTANQTGASFSSSTGSPPVSPTSSLTILVNGSFDEDPSWENTTDPEYQAIAASFGGTVYAFHWNGTDIYPPFYLDIYGGAQGLVNLINGYSFKPGEALNIVAHSHGGNVVKIASYGINHAINNLVNLGTPQNYDLPGLDWPLVGNYCQVSSFTDYVQFIGASPTQVYDFAEDEYYVGVWTEQEAIDLANGDYDAAEEDAAEIAYYQADALYWWLTTKIALDSADPINILFGTYSHSDLHTPAVWTMVVSGCYLP